LLAQGTVFERGEDQLVVAPDEFVGPALELAAALVQAEQEPLVLVLPFRVLRPFGPRLIDLLDDLEGEDDVADLGGLAVPDQFDLALVVEQQKAVSFRQRLVGLDETEDFLLFLLSQSRHGIPIP